MALIADDLGRTLAELVEALDRRTPRAGHPEESAIARDAAVLREKAVGLLATIARETAARVAEPLREPALAVTTSGIASPAEPADVVPLTIQEFARDAAILGEMAVDLLTKIGSETAPVAGEPAREAAPATRRTVFPATPADVVALTIQEFTLDLDERNENRAPTLARVCRTFFNDGNRALVWWIRFEALKGWCARKDVKARLKSGAFTLEDAWDQAASFPLNSRWQFDLAEFSSAVESWSQLLAARSSEGASRSADRRTGAQ